jgi:hypothetical protein
VDATPSSIQASPATEQPETPSTGSGPAGATGVAAPRSVILIAVTSFFVLIAVAASAEIDSRFGRWVSGHHLGRLPLAIVWFGAIGGSLASLTGIFWHNRVDWKDSYDLWHRLRPWTGLVMGSLGAFLVLVSTELATASSAAGGSGVSKPEAFNPDIYYAAAFFAGFAEAPFRALVKRLTDAIFGPGESAPKTDANS